MSNPTFKPSEGKREEFRKYLEKNGVMDALTKVLVNLYEEPEKPEDALDYIREKLAIQAGLDTFGQMKSKHEELEAKIAQLEEELEQMKLSQEAANAPPVEEGGEVPAPAEGEAGEEGAPVGEAPPEEAPAPSEEPAPEEQQPEQPQ